MPKISRKFLELLKKKLSYGSTRSILINSVPGSLASRLSLNDLDTIEKGLSNQFIKNLIEDPQFDFKFSISYDNSNASKRSKPELFNELAEESSSNNSKKSLIEKRLSTIKFDNDDNIKEHGVETFGLGFPILIKRNPNDIKKIIAAPIFIFPLSIKQSFDQNKQWVISRDSEKGIKLNEALKSYLNSEEHIDFPEIPESHLEDGILSKKEIDDFILSLEARLSIKNVKSLDLDALDTIPDKLNVENETVGESRILFSGVFGNYKSQKQSLINDIEELIKTESEEKDHNILWNLKTTPIEVDPSQNFALRSLADKTKVVIQGPPGTGKSQTLTAIIANGLANKKKILVVCEKRTALEVIYENITEKYPFLKQSIALIEDVSRDRNIVVKNAREREINGTSIIPTSLNKHSIRTELDYFENLIEKFDISYKNLREKIQDNSRWIDLVGKWLSMKIPQDNIQYFERIAKEIDFDIDNVSMSEIESNIDRGFKLFQKSKGYHSKYDQVFDLNNLSSNQKEFINQLSYFQFEMEMIIKDLIEIENKYIESVSDQFNNVFSNILMSSERYFSLYSYLQNKFKDPFNLTGFERIKQIFLKDRIQLSENRNELNLLKNELTDFIKMFDGIEYPNDHNFKRIFLHSKDSIFQQYKNSYLEKQKPNNSFLKVDDFNSLNNQLNRLNNYIREVSSFIKVILSPINTNAPLSISIQSIKNQSAFLKDLINKKNEVEDYLTWKFFISSCSDNISKLIKLLIKLESLNWVNDLRVSSLVKILSEHITSTELPDNENDLDAIHNTWSLIKIKQDEIIKNNIVDWYSNGLESIQRTELSFRKLYNLKGSPGSTRNSLRKIVKFNSDSFTDLHPLVLANPITASTLFPLKSGYFDIVIFDEASQLRIEDTFSSVFRGKTVIVSGDSQQMPPSSYFESNKTLVVDKDDDDDDDIDQILDVSSADMATKESLLEWAIEEGFHETYLDMHYRSRHPDLIEFSNACFYNSRLIPMPQRVDTIPILFKQVDGLYTNRVNEGEASEIISMIKTQLPTTKSIGVATFNLTQRNLILTLINQERSIDREFNKKMTLLEENGFFVKNLENIQGDERDIIIISTTFGKRQDGRFIMNFGPITQRNGHRLLNVIITRAKETVYVLTSIPEERQNEYRQLIQEEGKVSGKSGLLAYLSYAKYISLNDTESKDEILLFIKNQLAQTANSVNSDIGLTESPFEEEVYQTLVSEFGVSRVKPQYRCGGFRIDLVVETEKNKKIAIECDGSAYHSSELNWHHDIYRQKQLEQHGFIFHRIWSTSWWKNHEHEKEKLISFVQSFM